MRHAGHQTDGARNGGGDRQRLGVAADLRLDLLAEIFGGGNARDDQAGSDGDGQRRDLCSQAIAHRQQSVGARGISQR